MEFCLSHHDIHASKLGPDLCENTNVSAVDHLGLEELKVTDIGITAFEVDHVSDSLQLQMHERCVSITFGMDKGKDIVAVLPSIFLGKPSLEEC